MKKKAQVDIPLGTIVEIIIVLAVIALPLIIVGIIIKTSHAQEEILAGDMEMMINAMIAVPGDVSLEFPLDDSRNISDYSILITNNEVAIFSKKVTGSERLQVKRDYFLPEGYSAQGAVEEVEKFCLSKIGKAIILDKC